MKKMNLGFIMVGLVFLISISVLSCQADEADDYFQQAEDVTAADLFIASEAYQNLQKEIRKGIRRRRNAINELSSEGKEQYHQLKKQLLNSETRMEARVQLNILLKYDERTERNRIFSIFQEVYEGVDVTRLELIRARQKYQMHKIVIGTRAEDPEALENCNKKCDGDMEQGVTNCYEIFNTCLENVPAKEKLYQEGPRYEACVDSHDFCLDCCYFDLTGCQDACQEAYGKKEK